MARERRGFRAFSISVNREERIMAKHRVKKHKGGHKKGHRGLKIHGGFKAMEHKKERRKR